MLENDLLKINMHDPATIAQNANLSEAAIEMLSPSFNVKTYLDQLLKAEYFSDAIKFIANALPSREGIWWAYCCAKEAETAGATEEVSKTLKIVEHWVYQPNEEDRRAAEMAAKNLNFKTPSSWTAIAVFWSGGSIAPTGNPDVFISSQYIGVAVAGAIMLAAALDDSVDVNVKYKRYLQWGMNIASGGNGGM